ncbi:MAG: four helix bundle protein [Deltaproteobacteria bacterium]
MTKTYKELEIYKESFNLFLKTHRFTLKLPKHELYELGSQLRRSSDSINSNIVEGYGRNKYLKDFIRFLTFAYSSNNETINHLKKLENLYPEFNIELTDLINEYDNLGGKIYKFIEYVQCNWKT